MSGAIRLLRVNARRPVAYRVTRGMVQVVNALQMALAEAYINGLSFLIRSCERVIQEHTCRFSSNIFRRFSFPMNGSCEKRTILRRDPRT